MKAKDYAKNFDGNLSEDDFKKAVIKTITDFFIEVEEIKTSRNAFTDSSLLSILKEQDNKWRALSDIVLDLRPTGFRDFVAIKIPETKALLGW